MASVAASFVTLSTAGLQAATISKRLSVARFSGLKAGQIIRRNVVVFHPAAAIRSITIRTAAEPETLSAVQGIIAEQLAITIEKVVPEAKFAELGADSLDTVEIIMALEETFKISLDEEGAQKISTVQEAADMIQITMGEA